MSRDTLARLIEEYDGAMSDDFAAFAELGRWLVNHGPQLLALWEAAGHLADHVDFGVNPPGWNELRAALDALEDKT